MLAPAGTPASIVDKINAAINRGLQSPETQAIFAKFSAEAKIGSPQEFADFIATQAPIWGALVKAAALKIDREPQVSRAEFAVAVPHRDRQLG